MRKEDAPRLKKFVNKLLKMQLGSMSGNDMVLLVRDMEWLIDYAGSLEKPKDIVPIGPAFPIEDSKHKIEKKTKKVKK